MERRRGYAGAYTYQAEEEHEEEAELQIYDLIPDSQSQRTSTTNAGAATATTVSEEAPIDDLVAQFNTSVGNKNLERSIAEFYLEMCNHDVQQSAQFYIEQRIAEEEALSTSRRGDSRNSTNNCEGRVNSDSTRGNCSRTKPNMDMNMSLNTSIRLDNRDNSSVAVKNTVNDMSNSQSNRDNSNLSNSQSNRNSNMSNGNRSYTQGNLNSRLSNSRSATSTNPPRVRRPLMRTKSLDAAEGPVVTRPAGSRASIPLRSRSDGGATTSLSSSTPALSPATPRRRASLARRGSQIRTNLVAPLSVDAKNPDSVRQAASQLRERLNNSFSGGLSSTPHWNIVDDNARISTSSPSNRLRTRNSFHSTSATSSSFHQSFSALPTPIVSRSGHFPRRQRHTSGGTQGSNNTSSNHSSRTLNTSHHSIASERSSHREEPLLPTDVIISRPPTASRMANVNSNASNEITPTSLSATAEALAARNRFFYGPQVASSTGKMAIPVPTSANDGNGTSAPVSPAQQQQQKQQETQSRSPQQSQRELSTTRAKVSPESPNTSPERVTTTTEFTSLRSSSFEDIRKEAEEDFQTFHMDTDVDVDPEDDSDHIGAAAKAEADQDDDKLVDDALADLNAMMNEADKELAELMGSSC